MNKRLLAFALLLTKLSFSQGFQKLSPKESGINFINKIVEDDTINGLSYQYLYNGGGVAIGDINNDGLEDIYFTGNQVADKLFLNQGDLKFKDVTKKYFKNQRFDFHTGVTMVDINNDGWLDIYVSCAGPDTDPKNKKNKLYINNGGKYFEDKASEYGLDDSLNTTQSVFFDADNDGDLDCFVLNHIYRLENTQTNFQFNEPQKVDGYDRMLINENGRFVDKSDVWGVNLNGFGLGVVASDFNNDGYMDVYITNDYDMPDRLFLNYQGKKFRESIRQTTGHIPLYSMGVDAGDLNNDGWTDVMAVDMASEDHVRSKKNMGGMSSKNFWSIVNSGKHYQYMFNTLQLNLNGEFTDIAQMAHVAKTDWSWSTFFADFNNDGYQDLYVANGFVRDIRDNDFNIAYENKFKGSDEFIPFEELNKLIPQSKLRDYIFMNNQDLTFSDESIELGVLEKENVNGAIYADLDLDGDLDVICNQIDGPSFIRENLTNNESNYLNIRMSSQVAAKSTIGAKLFVIAGEKQFNRTYMPTRGFQSSATHILHFGLGEVSKIDRLVVQIGNQKFNYNGILEINRTIELAEKDLVPLIEDKKYTEPILYRTKVYGLKVKHFEIEHDDFKKEILLPHKMSQLGPDILVADVNNDGFEDVYITGARGMNGILAFQEPDGSFVIDTNQIWEENFHSEELGGVFFDADNDGDMDLYIVNGGNEAPMGHQTYKDRLYFNDGKGNFSFASGNIPNIKVSGQKVLSHDINYDGWMDLIVFGRQTPEAYPISPSSHILINKKGTFIDKTKDFSAEFEELGMVTDAVFVNVDSDEEKELIVVGEWMPITFFDLIDGKLVNITQQMGTENSVGWWNSIEVYIENNGNVNLICGNIGENNKYHPSLENPLQVYMDDFDENGTNDIILAKSQAAVLYPVRGRQCSSEQMPFIKDKFPTYDQFACASVESIYTKEKLERATQFKAHLFSSVRMSIIKGEVKIERLDSKFQTGPINDIVIQDLNGDGIKDMIICGNRFEAEVETVRYDGNPGYIVNGASGFQEALSLDLYDNIKSIECVLIDGKQHLVVGINNEAVKFFEINFK